MKSILTFCVLFLLMSCNDQKPTLSPNSQTYGPITLVIHGGAGTIKRENMTPEKENAYHAKLREALDSGYGGA